MILELIGEEQPFWENKNFLLFTYIALFVIFGITLLFIFDSLRNKSLKKRKAMHLFSLGTITFTYFILLIVFVSFLYLLCSEGICDFAAKKIHDMILLSAVIVANIGMIQRKSSGISFRYVNYIFAGYNLIISIYLIISILSSCNF